MTVSKTILTNQLKEVCKTSGARWAVWLSRSEGGWLFGSKHGLSKPRLQALTELTRQPTTATWLAGTFSSGRIRSRQTSSWKEKLDCERLFVFPNMAAHTALLVGADNLDKTAEGFIKALVLNPPGPALEAAAPAGYTEFAQDEVLSLRPWEAGLEMSYNPEGVLENVLEFLSGSVQCDAALLSIRSGDLFRVEAVHNCPGELRGADVSIRETEFLAEIAVTRQGVIIKKPSTLVKDRVHLGLLAALGNQPGELMVVPVVIGQRVIGHLAFGSTFPNNFTKSDLQRLTVQAGRLAYVVENAMVFAEAARYLQQLALLNELASAASLGADANEVSARVMKRLQRTFHTDSAGVFLLSSDGKLLREYGVESGEPASAGIPVALSLVGYVVESGLPLRLSEAAEIPGRMRFVSNQAAPQSELVVPLKYRGKVIGALALGSGLNNAFSLQDEQLLVVIASHLAGLFENMRLNEETRERAHNLNLIHQVVRGVIGLTDMEEIARVAADLMVKRFSYESAAVVLIASENDSLIVQATGEERLQQLNGSDRFSGRMKIIEEVLRDGMTRLVGDVHSEPAYAGTTGEEIGSQMCVPLREGEHILGAIDVGRRGKRAFSENDLLALEALAGVMSSVVLSARRYQQLQDSVRQLQAVRETSLDIAADLDLDALLKRVVHRARDLIGSKGAELGLLDDSEQIVRILVSETPWQTIAENKIPLLAGVAGRVAAFGEPLVVDDYNLWNGRLFPNREAPFKTVAGVPLKYQGKVIGTLTVIDDRPEWKIRPEHVQLLELLAPQVAVWIRNARLYQELQERIEAQRLAESRLIRSARLAAVGEMAAGVAHELNNPLTTVAGFVELVLEELPAESPHRPDLELVLREAHRARGVVRRMLDFSRPVENQRTRSQINELVSDVLMLVNHLAHTGGVELERNLWAGPQALPWISVDPAQIKQVLLNLIHNGIQAMPNGGKLAIRTAPVETEQPGSSEQQSWVTVAVQDTGEGITPENLDRIFEPFFTTRPAGSGTGLGLSVSYGIVTDHGGYIEVESQFGQGSCFTVFLPVESA